MASDSIPFNKVLRKETRDIHSISDALVNAKLAFALSDKDVWVEGLLVFYEIFRYLEKAMFQHKGTNLSRMYVEGMERTSSFEEDLTYYLGQNWKSNYIIRDEVGKYLTHLEELEKMNPDLLIAYVYHLYMGLLSGGQILRKKRDIAKRFHLNSGIGDPKDGNKVTDFGETNIRDLKNEIVNNINSIAILLDEDTKQKIIQESRKVFELNNEIISSIKGADVIFNKVLFVSVFAVLLFVILWKYPLWH